MIQRAMLVCEESQIQPHHLPRRFQREAKSSLLPEITFQLDAPLDEIERQIIIKALEVTGNNRTEAAKLLGISRRAIYNRLRKHSID